MRVEKPQFVPESGTVSGNAKIPDDPFAVAKALNQKSEILSVPDFYFGKNVSASRGSSKDAPNVPGFEAHEVQFIFDDGQKFSINLYVSEDLIPEEADKLSQKFMRVMSNLSPEFLDDFKNECKHVLLVKENEIEPQAWAQAIGELNQMFISESKMQSISDQQFAEVLIHETGHLVDRTIGFTGKGSDSWSKEFNQLKALITEDLGFNVETNSLTSTSELFADYFLNNRCEVSEEHRSKLLFNLLNQYSDDVKNLSTEDLQAKYGEKTDKVVTLTKAWGNLKRCFDYFLGNVYNSSDVVRMDESVKPLNFKQILKKVGR